MKKIILLLFVFVKLIYSQEIHLRTVPLAAGNQGDFYPSLSRGMGNLSIAFDDPLSDPLVNPAKTYKLNGLRLFFSPTRNTWSNEDGRAVFTTSGSAKYTGTAINSMPFGLFLKKGNFFTGGIISYQSYSSERTIPGYWESNSNTKSDFGNNVYLFGLIGTYFPELKLSVGGSISWTELDAMDGVNLLYPGSYDIKQYGRSLDYKIGFVGELSKQSQLEFVVGRTTFKSSHEVTYGLPYLWYEDGWNGYRIELNKDENKGWVIHTKYNSLINDEFKIGAIFTVNWKEHPKIPNYALANIPRDPGSSTAYNIGVGIVKSGERTLWGLEYIYEPMTSYTWAETGADDFTLPPSFKTIENFFDFYNHIIRAGIYSHTDNSWLDYRLGIQLHFNKYYLQQNDNIFNTSRTADENWLETALCGGLTINISSFQILYSLQVILGNGIVGSENNQVIAFDAAAMRSEADFLIAPNGALTVDDISLVTQQISFVYNLK